MNVKVNNQDLYQLSFFGISGSSLTKASSAEKTANVVNSANTIDVSITYNNGGIPSAKAYLDFIEVVGEKQLVADDFQFSFRSFEASKTTGTVEYQIENSSNIFQIWELMDFIH